jgi:hypothetical protein
MAKASIALTSWPTWIIFFFNQDTNCQETYEFVTDVAGNRRLCNALIQQNIDIAFDDRYLGDWQCISILK